MRNAHVNIVYLDEVSRWQREGRASYLYVGARRVYAQGSPYSREALRAQPQRYREVFRQGGASVFRISER